MNVLTMPRVVIVDGAILCDKNPLHYLQPCRDPWIYNCAWCGELKVDVLQLTMNKLK